MMKSRKTASRALPTTILLVLSTLGPQAVLSDDDPAMTRGDVRRIDADSGVLTIRHDRIEHLDMPPMTMDFRIADRGVLEGVVKGAPVDFYVLDEDGTLVIHDLVVVD